MIWSIVAVFTATQLYLKSLQDGTNPNWWTLFKVQLLVWWLWGLITPFVFWLGNRFRIDRTSIWKILFIHVPIAVIIVCFYLSIYSVIWNFESQGSLSFNGFLYVWQLLFTNLFHWHFFIYMAIIGIVHARSYYMDSKNQAMQSLQLEKQLLQSQLSLLKMQLQPHFLFNALNSIVSSIHQGKTGVAANMVTELSELLRMSLSGTDRQIIALGEELKYVKTYLNIEQFRFKDLEVQIDIPKNMLDLEVPSFMLQPIVENAIKHGVSKKSYARLIALSAKMEGDAIFFKIFNEGPPIDHFEDGIGLSNIKKRLDALFGDKGKIALYPEENGTMVAIEIPKA